MGSLYIWELRDQMPSAWTAMILVHSSTALGDAKGTMVFSHEQAQTIWCIFCSNYQPMLRFEPGSPRPRCIHNKWRNNFVSNDELDRSAKGPDSLQNFAFWLWCSLRSIHKWRHLARGERLVILWDLVEFVTKLTYRCVKVCMKSFIDRVPYSNLARTSF